MLENYQDRTKEYSTVEPKSRAVSLRNADNNGESHYHGHLPMADLRKHLEALRPGNGGASTSAVGKNPTPTRADLTNLLLIELLEKQGDQLRKLSERNENKDEDDNSSLFNKLTNHHPPTYNGAADPQAFEEWIRDMEKLFDVFRCPDTWRAGFDGFYLKGEVELWWTMVKKKQNKLGFGWAQFKEP